MNNEVTFVKGMIAKRQDNAPDFVLCNLSLKIDELIRFMEEHQNNGWVNIDVKKNKQGKPYAALNTWKPTNQGGQVTNQGGNSFDQPSQDFNNRFPPAGQPQGSDEVIPF